MKTLIDIKSILCLTALVLVLSFSGLVHAAGTINKKYSPALITKKAGTKKAGTKQAGPLADKSHVAWSPAGDRLAYIRGGTVSIYNVNNEKTSKINITNAYFLAWPAQDKLLVLHKGAEGVMLAQVDTQTMKAVSSPMPVSANAIYPLWGKQRIVITSVETAKLSIGLDVYYRLSVMDLADSKVKEKFHANRIQNRRAAAAPSIPGWVRAGQGPILGELLLMQYIDPPALSAYIRLSIVDYATGKQREITRNLDFLSSLSGDWSPRGRRFALVDGQGKLRLVGLDGTVRLVDDSITGDHPSWNPMGGPIFFGGYTVTPDGATKELLIQDGRASLGWWSPGGTALAVLDKKARLWLLRGFESVSPAKDRPLEKEVLKKLRFLKELSLEGLIDKEDYARRHEKILKPAKAIR